MKKVYLIRVKQSTRTNGSPFSMDDAKKELSHLMQESPSRHDAVEDVTLDLLKAQDLVEGYNRHCSVLIHPRQEPERTTEYFMVCRFFYVDTRYAV